MSNQNQLVASTNSQMQVTKPSNSLTLHCRSVEENDLILAIYNKENKDINSLIDVLAKWRWMSGINVSNQHEDDVARELALLSQFVVKNYPNITTDEISLAIDLSLTNKLDVDVRTFNSFSPMYVSRILNAYLEYRKIKYDEIYERKVRAEAKKKIEEKPSPEQRMVAMRDLILYFWEQYKSDGEVKDHFNVLYDYLKRTNQLNLSKELIDEAIKYGKEKAIGYVANYFTDHLGREKESSDSFEKRFARNYCIQKMFDDCEDVDLIVSKVTINHFIDV
jgi:hypothetical protein